MASTPYTPPLRYTRFRYSSRIWSFESTCSSITASAASRALRPSVRWFERKSVRASCWVSVLPPCAAPRRRTSVQSARAMPTGSTPGCR